MTDDGTRLLTIGQLARRTGLPVRTIRYWSDAGALTPVARSAGGYRLYDTASVARLELVRTLRELGLPLADVRRVLRGETTVAQLAAAHVAALDTQIRSLRITRAVLSTVAHRGSTAEETTFMNKLARLSAAERRRIIDDFLSEVFSGLDTVDPVVRDRLHTPVDLPDDPTPEQVDAWVELAELLQDADFRARMRRTIEFNACARRADSPPGASLWFPKRLVQLVGPARERGVAPEDPEADAVLDELLGPDADRAAVLRRLEAGANADGMRYRGLMAVVAGREPLPGHAEEFAWTQAALRARLSG